MTQELDAMLAAGAFGAVYFVDDNFIGNRRAARELVEALIVWQKPTAIPSRSPAKRRSTSPSTPSS